MRNKEVMVELNISANNMYCPNECYMCVYSKNPKNINSTLNYQNYLNDMLSALNNLGVSDDKLNISFLGPENFKFWKHLFDFSELKNFRICSSFSNPIINERIIEACKLFKYPPVVEYGLKPFLFEKSFPWVEKLLRETNNKVFIGINFGYPVNQKMREIIERVLSLQTIYSKERVVFNIMFMKTVLHVPDKLKLLMQQLYECKDLLNLLKEEHILVNNYPCFKNIDNISFKDNQNVYIISNRGNHQIDHFADSLFSRNLVNRLPDIYKHVIWDIDKYKKFSNFMLNIYNCHQNFEDKLICYNHRTFVINKPLHTLISCVACQFLNYNDDGFGDDIDCRVELFKKALNEKLEVLNLTKQYEVLCKLYNGEKITHYDYQMRHDYFENTNIEILNWLDGQNRPMVYTDRKIVNKEEQTCTTNNNVQID